MNQYLDTLTEHFDIPKVSWTKWNLSVSPRLPSMLHHHIYYVVSVFVMLHYIVTCAFCHSHLNASNLRCFLVCKENSYSYSIWSVTKLQLTFMHTPWICLNSHSCSPPLCYCILLMIPVIVQRKWYWRTSIYIIGGSLLSKSNVHTNTVLVTLIHYDRLPQCFRFLQQLLHKSINPCM